MPCIYMYVCTVSLTPPHSTPLHSTPLTMLITHTMSLTMYVCMYVYCMYWGEKKRLYVMLCYVIIILQTGGVKQRFAVNVSLDKMKLKITKTCSLIYNIHTYRHMSLLTHIRSLNKSGVRSYLDYERSSGHQWDEQECKWMDMDVRYVPHIKHSRKRSACKVKM